ncbi:protein adenylyltransferase SelO family protein [bacterium]|nr:protein adenylyltransferase SelO family protein [bacterium]
MAAIPKKYLENTRKRNYGAISKIDGSHPFKEATSFSYVEYGARKRNGGRIQFLNFDLAKELGLIAKNHAEKMNKDLEKQLLDTFAITIINEFDLINNKKIPKKDVLDRKYMATRYLQLQNPNKKGVYSGDGRSIWNGYVETKNGIWDITSCGTGATCLSPATKVHGRFFETGDPYISYGCGYSTFHEGIVDIIFSEMFHQKQVQSERILCVVTFPDGFSIKVRAGQNLIRPSHMFAHLKQGKHTRLKEVVDYFIDREEINSELVKYNGAKKYNNFLEKFAFKFAEISALFEQEYIFCWLDWDGDNIMVNGGVLDFGSIRQFGVYHHEYKFDDDGNWSTNIKQQVKKARETVQAMIQAVEFVKSGEKTALSNFKNHKMLDYFDKVYAQKSIYFFARRLGFDEDTCRVLSKAKNTKFKKCLDLFAKLEERKARAGMELTPDGKNCPMMFNMRKFSRLSFNNRLDLDLVEEVLNDSKTKYSLENRINVKKEDIKIARELWENLKNFVESKSLSYKKISNSSAKWNPVNRITGDGICMVADYLTKKSKDISHDEFYKVVDLYLKRQRNGENLKLQYFDLSAKANKKVFSVSKHIEKIIKIYNETI